MRRRVRIDLGQKVASSKEAANLERKRTKWAQVNKDKPPEENPFLEAIKPDRGEFGDPDEKGDELKQRLNNLEFGNFPGYYQYRTKKHDTSDRDTSGKKDKTQTDNMEDEDFDERLKHLKKEWFFNKDVLDIGCNRGHVTYAIAKLFCPRSIIGIDIDQKIISMANRDLHLLLEDSLIKQSILERKQLAARLKLSDNNNETYVEPDHHYPLSNYIAQGPIALSRAIDVDKDEEKEPQFTFPNNIIFLEHNYVLSSDNLVEKQKEQFDVIVCFSVTKWIHLNYRDAGLKRFFRRIYRHLKSDGGLFALEAQPFDNYGRRRKLSERLKANFYSIQFKPDQFDNYLLSEEVGFKKIIYESVLNHECAGFKRPIKVFVK